MSKQYRCIAMLLGAWVGLAAQAAQAAVVVVANRTADHVKFQLKRAGEEPVRHVLPSGEVLPLTAARSIRLTLLESPDDGSYELGGNRAYFFARDEEGQLVLTEIGLGEPLASPGPEVADPPGAVTTIPVKVLVDDDEVTVPRIWQRRLRHRLEAASEILNAQCRVRFKVVAAGTWYSDDRVDDFQQTLREFEKRVDPQPGRLAIGYTSQYRQGRGRIKLGGTRGMLHSHILLREYGSKFSEAERLEALVHELGHFLGAAHSVEPDSVMRPLLGRRRARGKDFRIRFDPVNALAMCLVAEDLRLRGVTKRSELSPAVRHRLWQIYRVQSQALPQDSSNARYRAYLEQLRRAALIQATRSVVERITAAAREYADQEETAPTQREQAPGPSGDDLADHCVRRAALAAGSLSADVDRPAFLLGLAIGLDPQQRLRQTDSLGKFCQAVDSDAQRSERNEALRELTLRGSDDLAGTFFLAGALVSLGRTEASGKLAQQLAQAGRPEQFSFARLMAQQAGARFAAAILKRTVELSQVAEDFRGADFMPSIDGLAEQLTAEQLAERYGSASDPRFQRVLRDIKDRLDRLPGYRAAASGRNPAGPPSP